MFCFLVIAERKFTSDSGGSFHNHDESESGSGDFDRRGRLDRGENSGDFGSTSDDRLFSPDRDGASSTPSDCGSGADCVSGGGPAKTGKLALRYPPHKNN